MNGLQGGGPPLFKLCVLAKIILILYIALCVSIANICCCFGSGHSTKDRLVECSNIGLGDPRMAEEIKPWGPWRLPGNGWGKLLPSERDIIARATNCSAAVRERKQWGPGLFLTVVGPESTKDDARQMAEEFVLASQDDDPGPRQPTEE